MTRVRLLELAQDIHVAEAATAEEALILLKRDKYDCVVSDHQLAGMSGLDLLGALRKRRSRIPFIILTEFDDCRLGREARAVGVGDFRVKSGAQTDFAGLLKSIRRLTAEGAAGPQDSVQEIADSEALKEAICSIFERSTVGFYRTTPSGRIVMANPALVRMLGYSSLDELMKIDLEGNGWGADYARDDAKRQLAEKGEIVGLEIRWIRKGGTPIYLRENASVIRDENGDVIYYQGTLEDITEKKKAEEELKRSVEQLELRTQQLNASNKELEAFAQTISHDLQAPLRRISGWIEIILSGFDEELPEKAKEYLSRIDRNSREMSTLVEAILNFSRVMAAQIVSSEVNLETIARRLVSELQSDQPQRKVEFRLGTDLNCQGDPVLLNVLVKNLLGNAWKYTSAIEGAVIEFGSTNQDGKTVFYVKDNGIGFDQEKAGILFTPFQRLHTGTAFEGSGIGLATAQRIVHRHGGSIWAEGKPGGGASFYFTLS